MYAQDHKKAQQLREQLWALQDQAAGRTVYVYMLYVYMDMINDEFAYSKQNVLNVNSIAFELLLKAM